VGGNNDDTAYEEVDFGAAGRNYGWPDCESAPAATDVGGQFGVSGIRRIRYIPSNLPPQLRLEGASPALPASRSNVARKCFIVIRHKERHVNSYRLAAGKQDGGATRACRCGIVETLGRVPASEISSFVFG